jgi:predicted DNA binding protein
MSSQGLRPRKDDSKYRQLKLKIWHERCWTLDVTGAHPDSHIIEKSIHGSDERIIADLIVRTEGDADLDAFIRSIRNHELVDDVAVLRANADRARLVVTYTLADSIVPNIVDSNYMPIEPVHVSNGYEYWTVLVRADQIEETIDNLRHEHDINMLAINEVSPSEGIVFTDFVDEIYDTLSDRQLEALLTAKSEGYYSWPREIKANEVAEEVGVTGPTFLEHLRKAEHKILVPLLEKIEEKREGYHYLDERI